MPVKNYENLDINSDITTTRTLLHEVIPLTGTIVSGTYGTFPNDENIKNYSHGMFQSVYDYPYLSSSANHIFDLTIGFDETSTLSGSSTTQNSKKINLYNQFAQTLLGYTGSTTDGVRKFENDLTLDSTGSMLNCFFINFSRLLTKDQIKKGSFSITLGTGSHAAPFAGTRTLFDISSSATAGTTNTVGGDYGELILSSSTGGHTVSHGVIFYQAGIAVLSSSVFGGVSDFQSGSVYGLSATDSDRTALQTLASSSISGACDAFRHRIQNLSFNNTTEINSKIYFCRVPHNKYNYSSNPTYLSGSKIVVKEVATDPPVSYITTVGLYSAANELLATAKLSEPLKKDPSNELILRVRLDY
tara:strand:- start:241 stop:1317 length:1077 start_codon:yes stop_codon:yes gene_type:complete